MNIGTKKTLVSLLVLISMAYSDNIECIKAYNLTIGKLINGDKTFIESYKN